MAVFALDRIVLYVSFCFLSLNVRFLRLIVCIMYTYRICIVHTSGVFLFVHFLNRIAFHYLSILGAGIGRHLASLPALKVVISATSQLYPAAHLLCSYLGVEPPGLSG